MARPSMPSSRLRSFLPTRQILFHQLLIAARKTWLLEALGRTLGSVDPAVIRLQVATYVPIDVQKLLASTGLRDEYVFPLPIVLEAQPSLVGYYRLLLGVSQKIFYAGGSGMGQFRSMEVHSTMSSTQKAKLPAFCKAMAMGLSELARQISPGVTRQDLEELPLLTLGAQFYGSNNNAIGTKAKDDVFLAIAEVVKRHTMRRDSTKILVKNSAGRTVTIFLRADPDVSVEEQVGEAIHKHVALEIKGGTDKSNAYNRAGEAEKSHVKAKKRGFRECWTIIATKGVDVGRLKGDSPTTSQWFDTSQVLGRRGAEWDDFKERLAGVVGIPVPA